MTFLSYFKRTLISSDVDVYLKIVGFPELLRVWRLRNAVRALPSVAPHEAEAVRDVLGDRGEEEGGQPGHRHHPDTQPTPRRWRLAWNGLWRILDPCPNALLSVHPFFAAIQEDARLVGRCWLLCTSGSVMVILICTMFIDVAMVMTVVMMSYDCDQEAWQRHGRSHSLVVGRHWEGGEPH